MKNHIKTIVLLGSLSAVVLGLGALVAPSYLYLFGVVALAMNFGAYFFPTASCFGCTVRGR